MLKERFFFGRSSETLQMWCIVQTVVWPTCYCEFSISNLPFHRKLSRHYNSSLTRFVNLVCVKSKYKWNIWCIVWYFLLDNISECSLDSIITLRARQDRFELCNMRCPNSVLYFVHELCSCRDNSKRFEYLKTCSVVTGKCAPIVPFSLFFCTFMCVFFVFWTVLHM